MRQSEALLGGLAVACLAFSAGTAMAATGGERDARVVPAAQGNVVKGADGRLTQVRFPQWPTDDYSRYSTHAYGDATPPAPVVRIPAPNLKGDAKKGAAIWLKAACVNCHALPGAGIGDGRWAGNVGPSLAGYGARGMDPSRTYQIIYDPRALNPDTLMPAWGAAKLLSGEEIAHLVAFLHGLGSDKALPGEEGQQPWSRPKPEAYFGDNQDPLRNPAALLAERGESLWGRVGAKGKSCGTCHGSDVEKAMGGKATTYPRYVPAYKRVMSIEEMVAYHGADTTGAALPMESDDNLQLSMFIKIQSNGLPIAIDLADPMNQEAADRGRKTFYRRIGQRNHACADCHAQERVEEKWLGGRYIARASTGLALTRTYPAWRTSFGQTWGLRRRFQWCMLPHGANNLAADAAEYADMELYLTALENGKAMNVPGLKD